jgi:predicted AAA+ superfamily ATPase
LENIVWRELYLKLWRKLFPIKYWRTTNDNEIDFIVEEKQAYEIKFSKNLIRENKYKLFRERYAQIPLEFITFDDVLPQVMLSGK